MTDRSKVLRVVVTCYQGFDAFIQNFIFLAVVFLLLVPSYLFGQQDLLNDNQIRLMSAKGRDKVELLIKLADEVMVIDPQEGLRFASEAEQLARNEKYPVLLSNALKLKADALFYLDSLQLSAQYYLQSAEVDLASSKPRMDSILRRLGDVGYVYQKMGWFDKAIEYHTQALKMSEQLHDTAEIATNLSNLGLSHKMLGQHNKAIDYFLRTLELDRLLGNEADMSITFNAIGMVYFAWGKYDQALEFLNQALEMDTLRGEESKVSIRLSNLSQVYLAMERPLEAIACLNRALEIDRRLGNQAKVGIRIHGLGLVHKSLANYEMAGNYFHEALDLFESLNYDFKVAALLADFGDLYTDMKNFNEAEKSYLTSYKLAASIRLRPTEMKAARGLYLLYKSLGRNAEALKYFETFKAYEDSMFSEESARLIQEFEVKYESEKKDKENSLLQKENEVRRRIQQLSSFIISALIVFAVVILWAFMLKRKALIQSKELFVKEMELSQLKMETIRNHNQYLEEALFAEEQIKKLQATSIEQKKQELTAAAMLIANKNEVFGKLKILARQIKSKQSPEDIDEAREIITEIDRQTDLDNQWDQFKIHFESVHNSFFENLRTRCNNLTPNDLKICAFIKLKISTKEISRLLNIAPESVNMHRYRLRKKLNLPPESSLDEIVSEM